ncbi:MAG: hypothetical protein BGO45_16560 [Microbacterium sp. 71-36]|uniref:hypothetical protein n=1 Tax=unclassified Microbacterium TaxID=2609290 RepID=UPI00086EA5C0|nr:MULTISPECIES: hypothetical protein [unclassified Microbacterium]MBN9212883.1 hypothetical protein [Microbacterium sp.]ODT40256.1 MAG: hypothetical protein ABS60_04580 [Microbacterium sp. SCN 71-17]OJV78267.1 MAG: hypothetical protein BGO45_16560 [Microbacterium sp. 71-36]
MTLPPRTDAVVSSAIVAYLGWGRAHMPTADQAAVADLARQNGVDPATLLRGVHEAIDASDQLEVTDLSASHDGGAALYKQRLRAARPDLSPDAVDALASRWFFHLRWLGVESGIDVPRYFVRYGGEGATPIPISLFRRCTVDGRPVDEVLKDVDHWRPDDRGRIEQALFFTLDSDLEEVTADEVAQFQEMVRTRTYVPFMDTRARPAKLQTVDAETIRATWTWVRTSDGWFASSATVAPGERPAEFSLYDREGLSYRAVPAAEVLQVERVDSEGLYEGHWIPLVSTWKQDGTRVHAPVPRRGAGYSAMLYPYRSPDWDALVALPRAEVHDDRGSNGGVSFLVPFSELSDYRETVTPLGWTAEADGR